MDQINDIKNENTDAWKKVLLARKMDRLHSLDIIDHIFEDFVELHGDRLMGDDKSLIGGIALLDQKSVTVIGQQKGSNVKEMEFRQYGMNRPEGYRKALRLMKQAEKFHRPIICFIDTPGAFPGVSAEEHGQAEAIARNLYEMARLEVPIISVIIGEGGSGGALALGIANKVIILENAIYSVVSPEGCASILFKDSRKAPEVAGKLKLTASELKDYGIVDYIISESCSTVELCNRIKHCILNILDNYIEGGDKISEERIQRFRSIGEDILF